MKASRLSLAAIAALGITTAHLSASNLIDIKLPSDNWKFIGVNGGFTEVTEGGSGNEINTTVYSSSASETIDDNISTTVISNMVTFRVIDHSSAREFSSAKMYASNYGSIHTYDGSYTQPEMYVYIPDGNTTPDIRIKYQSDYEGETFYIEINSTDIYSGTYDSAATYSNAQALTEFDVSSTTAVGDENLSLDYIFDRNISNNPGAAGVSGVKNDYSRSSNQDDMNSTDKLRIYHYNSADKKWETYIKTGTTVLNADFDSLEKGKGYWVKYEAGGGFNDGGLILGDEGIEISDYTAEDLTAGWNMMSFNDSSLIGTGGTGMIVELNSTAANEASFTVSDSGETESFTFTSTYTMSVADTNKTKIVQQFNKQIAQAKAFGTLSDNFNLVAYPTGVADKIALISDKKFRLKDAGGATTAVSSGDVNSTIKTATTLGGNQLYVPSLGIKATSGADINTTYVESVYGEYALALRIPTDTADFITGSPLADIGEINISIGDNNSSSDGSALAAALVNMSHLAAGIRGVAGNLQTVIIDTDSNDENDTIILVHDEHNFAVQDKMFVKTYKVNESAAEAATLVVKDINGTTTYSVLAGNANNTALELAEQLGVNSNFEANSTSGYLYLSTGNEDYRNFYIEQTSGDIARLELVEDSTEYNASGTVREVYSLENLGRATVDYYTKARLRFAKDTGASTELSGTNSWVEFNVTSPARDFMRIRYGYFKDLNASDTATSGHEYNTSISGKTVGVAYKGNDLNISILPISDLNSSTATVAADILAKAINYHFSEINTSIFNVTASASAGTLTLYGDFNFTIDVNTSAAFDFNISDKNSSALTFESNLTIPAMVSDLKYNRVYAGALTTDIESPVPAIQKITGYKVRKVLTTNENVSSGDISWNFIDLTKDSDDWFNEEDAYNLFSFDKEKGYWVYLEDVTDTTFDGFNDDGDNSELEVTLTYNHSFTNDTNNSTTLNAYTTKSYLTGGTITVDVSDMSDVSNVDRAVAILNGNKITLTKSGNSYVGTIEEISSLGDGATADLNVTFFTPESFSRTVSKSLDNSAPIRPVLSVTNGDLTAVTLTSSTDTVYFHSYSGVVDVSGTNIADANITASNGTATYNLCAAAESFSSNVGGYRFIAADNNNTSEGLVSNIGYLGTDANATIYPIYKNASILTVSGLTTDVLSMDYNSSCETSGTAETTDHAVQLTGNGYDVVVAFEASITEFSGVGPSALKSVDLEVDGTKVAQLLFDGDHYKNAGQKFLMQYDGNIYSTGFQVLRAGDGSSVDFTDDNITMLTGQTISE